MDTIDTTNATRKAMLRFACALALLTLLLPCPLFAQPGAGLVMGAPEEGWPPYHLPQREAPGFGILPDILEAACAALGVPLTYRSCPEKRCLRMLEAGTIDVYTKAREWVEAPEDFDWSRAVVPSEDTLLFTRARPVSAAREGGLAGLRVGTVLGYRYPALAAAFARGEVIRDDAPGVLYQIRKLVGGRTDAAVVNRLVAEWVIRENPEFVREDLCFAEVPLERAWFRFVFSKATAQGPLIDRLDAELERMRADGRLDTILERYR